MVFLLKTFVLELIRKASKKKLSSFHNRSFWDEMAKFTSSSFPCQWGCFSEKSSVKVTLIIKSYEYA